MSIVFVATKNHTQPLIYGDKKPEYVKFRETKRCKTVNLFLMNEIYWVYYLGIKMYLYSWANINTYYSLE